MLCACVCLCVLQCEKREALFFEVWLYQRVFSVHSNHFL